MNKYPLIFKQQSSETSRWRCTNIWLHSYNICYTSGSFYEVTEIFILIVKLVSGLCSKWKVYGELPFVHIFYSYIFKEQSCHHEEFFLWLFSYSVEKRHFCTCRVQRTQIRFRLVWILYTVLLYSASTWFSVAKGETSATNGR